jgi:L-ascorbate metabolism protein UlaG (beta-lactamase superfamily)
VVVILNCSTYIEESFMKVTILGSCSGTEPMAGRRHVSFTVETGGGVYWFDAGEGCSYTAHLLGIDLLAVRAIFITHTHMDHIGGLPNLLWTMRKINGRTQDPARRLDGKRVRALLPDLAPWEGIVRLLGGTEDNFEIEYELRPERYGDGVIYDDGTLRVTALHNAHLGTPEGAPPCGEDWRSYSFRIEADGQAIVFSGDVQSVKELAPLWRAPCDALLMETGHHKVEDICAYLRDSAAPIGQLVFIHHGRAILRDPIGEAIKARTMLTIPVSVADDGMVLEL